MHYPKEFEDQMKNLLGDQWEAFADSLNRPPFHALHFNPLFKDRDDAIQTFCLNRPHPVDHDGFYFDKEQVRPGLHPYHELGAYYIQEPAAMSVIPLASNMLNQANLIIDLCAAPGGKTIQAATLAPYAKIIACEIDKKRAGILYENIERLGLTNVMVVNCPPEKLIAQFQHCADVIIADMPCSGEGMFRKDSFAIADWSPAKVATCVNLQDKLLQVADQLIKENGCILYSTCTYNREENEEILDKFISTYPYELKYFKRFYPHEFDGEGQTAALLQRTVANPSQTPLCNQPTKPVKQTKLYLDFCQQIGMKAMPENQIHLRGDHLIYLPIDYPDLGTIPALLPGIDLGILKKDRFEPSHQLAKLHLESPDIQRVNYDINDSEIRAYLRGESLDISKKNVHHTGWTLVTVNELTAGWGKISNGILKNHYPKGLRKHL